ncbi:MAG: tRNA lysidine(34) synthetase TilS [Pseudomonadota bacterium]
MLTDLLAYAQFAPDFSTLDLTHTERVVLAVSGGGDSAALLYAFHAHWTRGLGRRADQLMAATVNHRVRADAAREAQAVAAWCEAMGMPHRTLVWTDPQPVGGFQEAARKARYRLLAEASQEFGSSVVLTGHTVDDQLETIAMRRARSESSDAPGLAGIAPATLYERQVWFARPLLNARRDDLRAYLSAHGLDWFDDPSNADARFERVRVRHAGATVPSGALSQAEEVAKARMRRARETAKWLLCHARVSGIDDHRFQANVPIGDADNEPAKNALAVLIMLVGNQRHQPDPAGLSRGLEILAARSGNQFTLGGCILRCADDHIFIQPEVRNTRTNGFAFDHLTTVWDLDVLDALDRLRSDPPVARPPVR